MCAHVFPAHETLLAPDAVGLDDLLVLIRYKGKRQFELLRELIVRFDRIDAHAEHHRALPLQFAEAIPKCTRLLGATGCVVLWIEIKDDVLSGQIGERDSAAAIGWRGEIRSLVAF